MDITLIIDLLYLLGYSIAVNLIMFLIGYSLKTDKLTDISYSLTILLLAWYGYLQSDYGVDDMAVITLITLWAFRLGGYLFYRIHKIGRDKRFDGIRENFYSFLAFWFMQGLTCMLILLPALILFARGSDQLHISILVGALIAGFGLIMETIADAQKFKFKLNAPNDFISRGLWKRLRHPNYTGELLFWIGIFISCFDSSNFYISMIGPLWIILIIVRFSGIPPLEERWKNIYGEDRAFKKYWEQSYRLIPYIY